MAIAQMNWGRMRYPMTDSRMGEFARALDSVYQAAERHPGFIWRISDQDSETQLQNLGFDGQTSATVSVWTNVTELRSYTFSGMHGEFLERKREWFENVDGPQLVIWDVEHGERPTFAEAFNRLEHLRKFGDSEQGYGWPFSV